MKLIELRKTKKLTQTEIAKHLNLTQSTYQHYENERAEPNIKTLCRLADLYNVSLDYLVDRSFVNDIGYLTDRQKQTVKLIKQLNEENLDNVDSFIKGLTINNNKTINKF